MEFLNDLLPILGVVVAGALTLFVLFVLMVLSVMLVTLSEKFKATLPGIDRSLVPLGQTPVGQAANAYLQQALPQMDDPNDPIIQAITGLDIFRRLQRAGLITPQQFSNGVAELVKNAIKLTNGVPDVDFTLVDSDAPPTPTS